MEKKSAMMHIRQLVADRDWALLLGVAVGHVTGDRGIR